jgi:hypothetical protein
MRKSNTFFMLLIWMGVLGCKISTIKDVSIPSNPHRLEDVKVGDVKSDVERKIGKASEYREFKKDELWIYDNNSSGRQLGTITFDIETQKVKGITFVPDLESKESKIDFLLKQKFTNMKFEEILTNRCQKDYIPTSVFYVNKKEGVIVRYNRHSQFVESYSKAESMYMDDLVKTIVSCP